MGGEAWHEDQGVLRPLMHTKELKPVSHSAPRHREKERRRIEPLQRGGHPARCPDRNAPAGRGPYREVRTAISNIVEAPLAKALDEHILFNFTGKVARVV